MAIDTLLPKKLGETDASYKSVIELNRTLSLAEKEHIGNITFTGPFGSGNSSVFITLMENLADLDQSLILTKASRFVSLRNGSDDLLDCVIENDCYENNPENMLLITMHLHTDDKTLSAENLNYTRIKTTNHESFVSYVEENVPAAIQCFKDENQDKSSEVLMFLLANEHIDSNVKVKYLTGQHNHIDSLIEVFSRKQQVNVEYDILACLLKISSHEDRKIQLTTSIIRNGVDNHDNINQFLAAIGGVYADICDNGKINC